MNVCKAFPLLHLSILSIRSTECAIESFIMNPRKTQMYKVLYDYSYDLSDLSLLEQIVLSDLIMFTDSTSNFEIFP